VDAHIALCDEGGRAGRCQEALAPVQEALQGISKATRTWIGRPVAPIQLWTPALESSHSFAWLLRKNI